MLRSMSIALALSAALMTSASAQTATSPAGTTAQAPAATTAPATQPATKLETAREPSPEAKARWEAFQAACGADLKTHCGTIERGTDAGRQQMRQCVETNKVKFSASCQTAISERAARREAQPKTMDAAKPKS